MNQLISKKYYSHFDDQGKKMMDYVTAATIRMTALIKGLLEFSRLGNKRAKAWVDCQELVRTITMDLDTVLKETKGIIKINDLLSVEGNQIELRMLFQNLISNALKFKRADIAPKIEVSN